VRVNIVIPPFSHLREVVLVRNKIKKYPTIQYNIIINLNIYSNYQMLPTFALRSATTFSNLSASYFVYSLKF
jgi:hypothetical protein